MAYTPLSRRKCLLIEESWFAEEPRIEKENPCEKNLSTEEYCEKACAWISSPYENESRPINPETQTCKGTETLDSVRRGGLSCTACGKYHAVCALQSPYYELVPLQEAAPAELYSSSNDGSGYVQRNSDFLYGRISAREPLLDKCHQPRFENMNESGKNKNFDVFMNKGRRLCLLPLSFTCYKISSSMFAV